MWMIHGVLFWIRTIKSKEGLVFKEDEKDVCLLMGRLFLVHSDQGRRSGGEVIMIFLR